MTTDDCVFVYLIKIYLFQRYVKKQNESVKGMSESARKRRRQRNLVTMKFNFINYLLETLSVGLFLFEKGPIIHFLYYVVNSCGTPLVYYLGIEENRMQAQDYFRILSTSSANVYVMTLYPRSHIRVVKRSRVSPAPTISQPAAASQEASPSQPSHSSHKQTQGIEVSMGLHKKRPLHATRNALAELTKIVFPTSILLSFLVISLCSCGSSDK